MFTEKKKKNEAVMQFKNIVENNSEKCFRRNAYNNRIRTNLNYK